MRHLGMAMLSTWIALCAPLDTTRGVEPDLLDVRLLTPLGELSPESLWMGAVPTVSDGAIGMAVVNDEVIARDLPSGRELWRIRDPQGHALGTLLMSAHRLFLHRIPRRIQAEHRWDFTGCAEVLRVATATGSWEEPIPAVSGAADQVVATSACAAGDHLLIARARWGIDARGEDECLALEVSSVGAGTNHWLRTWPCEAPLPQAGAFLLTGTQPTATHDDPRACTICGGLALICPGPTSAIHGISVEDGQERWSLERIWEYDRDFIGPSVWCHRMRRFGRDEVQEAFKRAGTKTINVTPEDKAAVDARLPEVITEWRKDFDAHCTAWITGGPWVVPRPSERGGEPANAILVAIAIGPRHGFVRNLAHARLFDLNEAGQVLAMGDPPRLMRDVIAAPSALAFIGDPLGVGAIRPFPHAREMAGMGGGPDCLLSLAWHSEPAGGMIDSWLSGAWRCGGALGEGVALQPLDGGAIAEPGDKLLSTRIDRIALSDGSRETWTLKVPLTGTASLPTQNYSTATRANGATATTSFALPVPSSSLTSLRILGDRLVATLGESGQQGQECRVLVFHLPKRP